MNAAKCFLAAGTAALALTLGACGNNNDGGALAGDERIPLVTSSGGPPPTDPSLSTVPPPATTPADPAGDDAAPPTTPADAPGPAGTVPDEASKRGERPRSFEARVQADQTAMLNVRTMVSLVEGCHSGRESYKRCNSHRELGDPGVLGLEIGKARGQVQISATDNGFRITGNSMSGAKFTVARGPSGDRFKCLQGRMPGACPANRAWSF